MNFKLALGTADLQKKPGFLLVEKALRKCGIFKDSYMNKNSHRPGWISFGKTLMATVLMQSQAMTDFQDISELNNNTIFVETLGGSISPETLRQHLNEIAEYDNVIPDIDSSVVVTLKGKQFKTVKHCGKSYIPLDIDVTPFHNPNVKKEEISKTYHKIDGFAPIMAYLGDFAIAFELRPGKQHSEKGAIEFLLRCLKIIDRLGIKTTVIFSSVSIQPTMMVISSMYLRKSISPTLSKEIPGVSLKSHMRNSPWKMYQARFPRITLNVCTTS